MGTRRQRTARRAPDDHIGRQREGDVRVAIADRGSLELAGGFQAIRAEELEQRFEHQQRLALVGLSLRVGPDDIVWRERDGHRGVGA